VSLYAITEELTRLADAAERAGCDSEEFAAALAEHTALLAEAFDAKADDYAALIRTCEVRAAARREEAKRFDLLSKADAALAERLRLALMSAMQRTGRTSVQTARFALAVRSNGGKVPLLIDDDAAVPPEYRIPVYEERIDKDAIRAALEANKTVAGARLGERGTRIDIK